MLCIQLYFDLVRLFQGKHTLLAIVRYWPDLLPKMLLMVVENPLLKKEAVAVVRISVVLLMCQPSAKGGHPFFFHF